MFFANTSITFLLELVVFLTGVWSVWLAKANSLYLFPIGLISTLISTFLLYKSALLGDMIINAYYSILSIYGWINWGRQNDRKQNIQKASIRHVIIGGGIFMLGLFFVLFIYDTYHTDIRYINYIDIFTTGIFFAAMWFMAKRLYEHWYLWVIGNAITIPLYIIKGLYILSFEYLVFLILALQGIFAWRKIYAKQK